MNYTDLLKYQIEIFNIQMIYWNRMRKKFTEELVIAETLSTPEEIIEHDLNVLQKFVFEQDDYLLQEKKRIDQKYGIAQDETALIPTQSP